MSLANWVRPARPASGTHPPGCELDRAVCGAPAGTRDRSKSGCPVTTRAGSLGLRGFTAPTCWPGGAFRLDGDVAADVADAETAITRLNVQASALADTEALARLLLRAESVASARIEGLEIGARRLLRAEAAREQGEPTRDVTAVEVLSNIDAMSAAIAETGPGDPISASTLLAFHQRLLENTRRARYDGQAPGETDLDQRQRVPPLLGGLRPAPRPNSSRS